MGDTPPRVLDRLHETARPRAHALETYSILDTPPERAFDTLAQLAADICDAPISAVSLLGPSRQWFKAKVGLDATETPIGYSFCAHAVVGGAELFEIRDAEQDGRFDTNPLVTGEPGIRFYAGVPLVTPEGVGLGALCVIDRRPRPDGLTELQARTLRTLADQVITQLELRRSIAERDLHMARHRSNAEELRWLANHDPLTGLANRSLFQARLQELVANDAAKGRLALLMLDLDHFKQINDQFGHEAGDGMLKAFAQRLTASVRGTDTVARLGGDEFAIILTDLRRPEDIAAVTASIYARLSEPLAYDGRFLPCRTTIGVALFPDHGASADTLARSADIALYAAKAAGRGRAAIFSADMLADHQRQSAMIDRARRAIQQGWVTPFYQPKIDLVTGEVAGFEALLRICEPGVPVQSPATIWAAFEDMDLANQLGEQMIEKIAADMALWQSDGVAFGRIAINASAVEFRDHGFADRLLDQLRAADVAPSRLELEVTETVLLDRDSNAVEQALRRLSDAGVCIALDDFGTGYASLSHLRSFPVDVLKIDQSFVRNINSDTQNRSIVKALLSLGRDLGMETVAEGIETEDQAAFVSEHGCCLGQGYLFAKALPADDVPGAVAQRAKHAADNRVVRLHPARRRETVA